MRIPFILILLATITGGFVLGQAPVDYFGQKLPGDTPTLFAPNLISVKGRFDYGLSFSPDGKELAYGVLDMKDESGQIYYSRKVDNKWPTPERARFLGNYSTYLPFFSPDNKSVLYTQTQQDSATYITDVWMADKLANDWSKPSRLPEPINSATREGSVCMTLNRTIYFSSGRDCIGAVNCPASIFCSKPVNGRYLTAKRVNQLNLQGDNESIFVSADESFAIISNVAPSDNHADLYLSFRVAADEWSMPTRLDSTINTKDWELRPFVSADNKYLFFTRITFSANGLVDSDIYWVNIEKML